VSTSRGVEDSSMSGDVAGSLDRLRDAYDRAVSACEDSVGDSNVMASPRQWGLVQGQVGALSREVTRVRADLTLLWKEVDEVRQSIMQVDSRQTEASRQWSLAHAEVAKESMSLTIQMTEEHGKLKKALDVQNTSIANIIHDLTSLQAVQQKEESARQEALQALSADLRQEAQERRVLAGELRQAFSDRVSEENTKREAIVYRLDEFSAATDALRQRHVSEAEKRDARHTELQESLLASMVGMQADLNSKTDNSIKDVHQAMNGITEKYQTLEQSLADHAAAATVAREADNEVRKSIAARSLERMSSQEAEFRQDLAALRHELREEADRRVQLSSEFRIEANQHVSDVKEVACDVAKLRLSAQQDSHERREVEAKVQQSMLAMETYWKDRPVLAASHRELEEMFRRELNHVVVLWEAGEAGLRSLISEKEVRINELCRDVRRLMDFEQEMRKDKKEVVPSSRIRVASPTERLVSNISPSTSAIAMTSPAQSSLPSQTASLVSPVPGIMTVSTADAMSPRPRTPGKAWPKPPSMLLGPGPQRMQSQPMQPMQAVQSMQPPRVDMATTTVLNGHGSALLPTAASASMPRAASTGNLRVRRKSHA